MSVEEILEKVTNEAVREVVTKVVNETRINLVTDAIKGARKSNMSEEQIATLLKYSYSAKIPEAELKKLLEETK